MLCCSCGDVLEKDLGPSILADCPEAIDGPLCDGCAEDVLDAVVSAEGDAFERGEFCGGDPGGY